LCKAAGGQIRSVPSWRDQRLYGVGDGSRSMPICRNCRLRREWCRRTSRG